MSEQRDQDAMRTIFSALIDATIDAGIDPYPVIVETLREMGYTVTPPAVDELTAEAQRLGLYDEPRVQWFDPDQDTREQNDELEQRARRARSAEDPGEPWPHVSDRVRRTLRGEWT